METNNKFNQALIPKERRLRNAETKGLLDSLEFFRTPNGSFWDPDEEYFNRNGYDIHGGHYSKEVEYIPGPDWLSDLGCYPDEKDKYTNDLNEDEAEGEEDLPEEFKGDFEEDYDESMPDVGGLSLEGNLSLLNLKDDKMIEKYLADSGINISELMPAKKKKTGKKKKSKKKSQDEEGWETVEEDEI